jgi:hypothetical protein
MEIAMNGIAWSKGLAGLGCVLLLACMIWTAKESMPGATADACQTNLAAALAAPASDDDNAGKLRITGRFPDKVTLGSRLCVVVAGVAAKPAAAPASPPAQADIMLYLNNERTSLSEKADSVPGPQLLIFPFGEHIDASTEPSKFWRGLVAGKTADGAMQLSVGVSRTQGSAPSSPPVKAIEFVVYKKQILALGAVAMAVLVVAFGFFAASTTVLRDTASVDAAGKPNGTYSLGRTQMALWLVLSVAGFIFLWLTFGFYLNVITNGILILLGINSVTGLAAVLIDQPPAAANQPQNAAPVRTTQGFLEDLVCDQDGAKLHRLQMMIWTSIMAAIFAWNVVWNFVFVNFDTNLLLLMGLVSGTYLGFKPKENR